MKKYLILFLMIAGIVLPVISFAGLPDFNGPFVICGTSTTKDCTLCDIFKTAQLIIDTIIGFLAIIAVPILIAAGGFMILLYGANPNLLNTGKTIIKNAIIGLIIALLAWTVINMIFNTFVNTDTTKFPGPWNEIKCEGGGINEDGDAGGVKDQCFCKTDVYDVNPQKYPSGASVIAKDYKATKMSSAEDCSSKCVLANKNTYCHNRTVTPEAGYQLACYSQSALEADKNVSCKQSKSVSTMVKCFSTKNDCDKAINALDPNDPNYNKNCWIDDNFYCECHETATVCMQPTPVGLKLTQNEISINPYSDVWTCTQNCGYIGGFCGTLSDISSDDDDDDEIENVCSEKKDLFNCFDGYQCKQMIESQTTDACTELKQMLNCMKGKLGTSDKMISSISDNSPDTNGALGRCFEPSSNWKLCGNSKDSCGGECCGHSLCSLHYGGKGNSDSSSIVKSTCGIGSADCRNCSWAVDFANGTSFDNLKEAAENCAEELWDGQMETIYILNEGNHVHLQLNGVAKYHKCK